MHQNKQGQDKIIVDMSFFISKLSFSKLRKLMLIFVTKRVAEFVYHFTLYLPPLLTWIRPSPHTCLHHLPLREFVYIYLPLCRPQFCLAWQKLMKLTVLYTLFVAEKWLPKLKLSNMKFKVICMTLFKGWSVQFSRTPTPPLSIYVQNSSSPMILDAQFQTNPPLPSLLHTIIKRKHNPRMTIMLSGPSFRSAIIY